MVVCLKPEVSIATQKIFNIKVTHKRCGGCTLISIPKITVDKQSVVQ